MTKLPLAIAALALACAARAEYPERPVTIVVPFAAGGPTDNVARHLAEALRKPLGQPVAIENIGGLGGTLGVTKVAKAAPDGHTLLLYHIGMATSPALHREMPYKALDDFEYLGLVNEVPMTLIGRPSLPAQTFAELRSWMKAQRSRIHLANASPGAASHLCGLLLKSMLRVDMATVAYKGTAPAMADLLGGHVDLLCDQTTHTTAPIDSGRVRAYAVTTARRLDTPALRHLPTLDEAGLKGFNISIWHGLYAPRGTPAQVTEKLNAALRQALQDADFVQREQALGAVIVNDDRLSPAGHKAFVAAEIRRWAPVIEAAGQFAD